VSRSATPSSIASPEGGFHTARGTTFTVRRTGDRDGIYIQRARLAGRPLDRAWITHDGVIAGGTLTVEMDPSRTAGGVRTHDTGHHQQTYRPRLRHLPWRTRQRELVGAINPPLAAW
jgi:hypothetical protein